MIKPTTKGGCPTGHGRCAEKAIDIGEMAEDSIMRTLKTIAALIFMMAAVMVLPAVAAADSAICSNGILSDDAGQGCSDGLYEQVYGSTGGSSSSGGSDGAICYDGILSNDAGQGCSDGLYEAVYGSGGSTSTFSSSGGSSSYGGGSSNSMVDPHCESSGNSQIVSSNGLYWGKYQFDYSTWVAHGGSPGSYGNASESVQDQVASRVTYDAWPNC